MWMPVEVVQSAQRYQDAKKIIGAVLDLNVLTCVFVRLVNLTNDVIKEIVNLFQLVKLDC